MLTSEFDYELPPELIAQEPLAERDASRLLVVHRDSGHFEHRRFSDLGDYLRRGDVLTGNDSRVIPARLFGRKLGADGEPGARVELLLLREVTARRWRALVGGRGLTAGREVALLDRDEALTPYRVRIMAEMDGPQREVEFNRPVSDILNDVGHAPLPPYITHALKDEARYQTVYARPAGSAAAPTAGLHFTPELLLSLREEGVRFETVTLHVGLDTFQPVKSEVIADHPMHTEWATLAPQTAQRINEGKLSGARLVAVGTTAVRTLETAALRSAGLPGSLQSVSARDAAGDATAFCPWRPVAAFEGDTDLFIYPGYRFRAVDALITNFHLPQSTLLMLVSAFAGRDLMRAAYEEAIRQRYRFYSLGDAMLIL